MTRHHAGATPVAAPPSRDVAADRGHGSLLEAMVGALPDAVAVVSGDGAVIEANEAFCRLAGYERTALVGRLIPLRDGLPTVSGHDPRDAAPLASFMASVVVVCADGSQSNVLASFESLAYGSESRVAYIVRVQLETVSLDRLLRHRRQPRSATRSSTRRRPLTPGSRRVTSELQLAAERGEFFSRYQPIVSLRTGEIEAFEALLRWHHPLHGVVGPGAFMGEAEARGILAEISCQTLHDACVDAAHWNTLRNGSQPLSVSVNLCGSQLRDPHLIESVEDALATSGLAAPQLWLEITENTGITEAARDPGLLADLRGLGIKLVLDDFGSGYASLGSLRRLPLDILKFDRSLVNGAAENRCDARILAAGVEIAQALEIDVIAEGIERRVQMEYLQSLDCASGQGYFFSRPIDRERVDILVAQSPNWIGVVET